MSEHVSSVVTTQRELLDYLDRVQEATGDPAAGTCLMFVPWMPAVLTENNKPVDYVAAWDAGTGVMLLDFVDGQQRRALPLEISMEPPLLRRVLEGAMVRYQARKICNGIWALNPSLNIPEMMHGYVVLHGVPDPAPWEKRIVLASA
jgi:hypothetical protein